MVKRLLLLLLLIILLPCLSINVFAEEDVSDEYRDVVDSIPDDVADLLPDDIFSNNSEAIKNGMDKLTSWNYLMDKLFEILGLNLKDLFKGFASIIFLLILCSLLNMIKKSISSDEMEQVLDLVGCAAISGTVLSISQPIIDKTIVLCDEITTFANSVSPTMCALYAMGGNVSTAIVHNYGLIVFLTIFENVITILLQFILSVCMSLVIASLFMGDSNLLSLNKALKSTFTFALGLLMLIFTTVISTQTLLSSKADTLTSKTAKMLSAQFIPLVGGSIGETLRTAGASIEYLRSNIGVLLIIVFMLMVLPTIISLFTFRIIIALSNGIAGLLGCEREGRILQEISSIFGYVIAILSVSSLSFLFLLTTFAKCSSPLL